jgi:hypothetical protein
VTFRGSYDKSEYGQVGAFTRNNLKKPLPRKSLVDRSMDMDFNYCKELARVAGG